MGERSDFFKSLGGDRKYSADQFANRFRQYLINGVFVNDAQELTDELQVTANDNDLNISIDLGGAVIQGYFYEIYGTAEIVSLSPGDSLNPRKDLIILRLDIDNTARSIVVTSKKGTPAASPTPPALTQSGTIFEIALAEILVPANVTLILDVNVVDERDPVTLKLKTAELTEEDVANTAYLFA